MSEKGENRSFFRKTKLKENEIILILRTII